MAEYTQLQEEQPISNRVPVVSGAEGDNALASVFGDAARGSLQTATSMEEQQSAIGKLYAQNNINSLKNAAHASMIFNPDQAMNIFQQTATNAHTVSDSIPLNKTDRARLALDTNNDMGDLSIFAARLQHKNDMRQLSDTHFNNTPQILDAIAQDHFKDPQKAQDETQTFVDSIQNGLRLGAIKPLQAANMMAALNGQLDKSGRLMDLLNSTKISAQAHAQANFSPFGAHADQVADNPTNGNTSYLHQDLNEDYTNQGLINKIRTPGYYLTGEDAYHVSLLKPEQFERVSQEIQGRAAGESAVLSNQSWSSTNATYNNLKSTKSPSYSQQAQLAYLENYRNSLANGGYQKVITATPLGAQASQNYANDSAAIASNATLTPQQQFTMQKTADNKLITSLANVGKSEGMPNQYIQPVPARLLQPIQGGFMLGGDVDKAMGAMNYLAPENQAYAIRSLKTSQQRAAATMATMLSNGTAPDKIADLVAANQQGRDYSNLKMDQSGKSPAALRLKIATNPEISGVMAYQNLNAKDTGFTPGQDMVGGIQNYVQYTAQKYNDLTLQHADDHINDISSELAKGYQIRQGSGYTFNNSSLKLSDNELDSLSTYMQQQARKSMLAHGISAPVTGHVLDATPLTVTNTPDGFIKVVNPYGRTVVQVPYTSDLVTAANHDASVSEAQRTKVQNAVVFNAVANR